MGTALVEAVAEVITFGGVCAEAICRFSSLRCDLTDDEATDDESECSWKDDLQSIIISNKAFTFYSGRPWDLPGCLASPRFKRLHVNVHGCILVLHRNLCGGLHGGLGFAQRPQVARINLSSNWPSHPLGFLEKKSMLLQNFFGI